MPIRSRMSTYEEQGLRPRFYQTLAFKLSLAIFMISSVLLSSLGIYYIRSFAAEIEERLRVQSQIPGLLMNEGSLPLSVVRDLHLLSSLVGEDVLLAVVEGEDGVVRYSSDRTMEGARADGMLPQSERPARDRRSGVLPGNHACAGIRR